MEGGGASIKGGILSAIGDTPLIKMANIFSPLRFHLFAKLEMFNPGGSMKDRPAANMIREGLKSGSIRADSVIIESSSGNMGIGLAQVCSYFGLKFICVIDAKTTIQNRLLLQAYGAEVDLVDKPDPETGEFLQARLNRVKDLLALHKNAFWTNQYANTDNSDAHHQTMREIVDALDGKVDFLFCSASTCGTLRGCSEFIRKHNLPTKIIAVDAIGSVIFDGQPAKRLIPGHGAAVKPSLYQPGLAHRVVHLTDCECIIGCRALARREAILVGGSSGAIIMAINRLRSSIPEGATCVAILPDRGERYLDTIYSDSWVEEHFGPLSRIHQEYGQHQVI
jgi:cysteine synthase A